MTEIRCVVEAQAETGESPVWDDNYHLLYWTDIPGRKLHRFDPSTGHDAVWDMPGEVGAVALRASGGVVLAMRHGFYGFDFMEPTPWLLAPLAGEPEGNRLNDGRVDAEGRFWCGTFNPSREPTGALYCLDGNRDVMRKRGDIGCSNALCWSPDGKTMYHADSFAGKIQAWDFDPSTGAIANPRLFVEMAPDEGAPDGAVVDAEGCLWVAQIGGGRVIRYDSDGKPIQTIALPVRDVTCPCFGGRDLTTLYVTSGAFRVPASERAAQPLAGGLFAIETEVAGLPENRFGG